MQTSLKTKTTTSQDHPSKTHPTPVKLAAGTGASVVVEHCQVCGQSNLQPVLFLGYLPPVNQMRTIGDSPHEQPAYPAMLLQCKNCKLVQLGLIVDPEILFPPDYPYTSGTTKILRENFAQLYEQCQTLLPLTPDHLIVDIGSNDGTLLSNFHQGGLRVCGIEPSDMGTLANQRGIKTKLGFFNRKMAQQVLDDEGPATIITATNVFAHIENVHEIVESILLLLDEKGIFITESHYLLGLIETLQYDTIYHEHLRHYSLHSLKYLFEMHAMEIVHACRIPTHGGSIRVYATRQGTHPVDPSVQELLDQETQAGLDDQRLKDFKQKVTTSKLELYSLLSQIKQKGEKIYAIGAPSRASTLINYVGLDDGILDCVLEIKGSYKIGKFMPGTVIPVLEESKLFSDPPDYALLLSWHIADELIPKLKAKGYKGKFIIPLPTPRIVE
ncbi:MAG: class I SAM-dependent methyltransferase [Planctomycetes bacterium]|nr:class I SAM-dependent methyltransferase [Planctomycetota bacterium]